MPTLLVFFHTDFPTTVQRPQINTCQSNSLPFLPVALCLLWGPAGRKENLMSYLEIFQDNTEKEIH